MKLLQIYTYTCTHTHTCIHIVSVHGLMYCSRLTQYQVATHTHVRTYARALLHTYRHTHIHTYTHTHIHFYTRIYKMTLLQIHTYTYTHLHIYTHFACIYIHTSTQRCTHTHTHVQTHTHTHTPASACTEISLPRVFLAVLVVSPGVG